MNGYFKLPNGLWVSEIDGTGPYTFDGSGFIICGTQGSAVPGSPNAFFKLDSGFWTRNSDGSGPYVQISVGQFKLQSTGAGGGSGSVAWGGITGALSAQTDLNTALGLKAPLASPALTGSPTAPTQSQADNSTKLATTAYVDILGATKASVVPGLLTSNSAAANTTALQTALNAGGYILILTPGTYYFSTQLTIPSNTTLYVGGGVVLAADPTGYVNSASNQIFGGLLTNSNHFTGNVNIAIIGDGTISMSMTPASLRSANYAACIHMEYVTGLVVGKGLKTTAGFRGLNMFRCVDFVVSEFTYNTVNQGTGRAYTTNNAGYAVGVSTVNLITGTGTIWQGAAIFFTGDSTQYVVTSASFSGPGAITFTPTLAHSIAASPVAVTIKARTGTNDSHIFVSGQSNNGVIEKVYGLANDDIVTLNTRDVAGQTTPNSVGAISNITIRDVFGSTKFFSGQVVVLYGGRWDSGDANAGTPPTITGITQSGGIATVTTDVAHGMGVGSHFGIASSNPSQYNTNAANGNGSNGIGTVRSVPSATTFTYYVNTGTGAYVSSAALVIYYDFSNITVDSIYGSSLNDTGVAGNGCVVQFTASIGYGVMSNFTVRNIHGVPCGAAGTYLNWAQATTFDFIFDGLVSALQAVNPLTDMVNASYLAGTTIFRGITQLLAYTDNNSSGAAFINLNGFDNVEAHESAFKIAAEASGTYWVFSPANGNSLKLNGIYMEGSANQSMILVSGSSLPKSIVFDNISTLLADRLLNVGGGSSTYDFQFNNVRCDGLRDVVMSNFAGATAVVNIQANNVIMRNSSSAAFLRQAPTAGCVTNVQVSNFTSDKSAPAFLEAGASPVPNMTGATLSIDLSNIARKAGSIVVSSANTGSGGATDILASNLCVCDATATTGSWKQVSAPTTRSF